MFVRKFDSFPSIAAILALSGVVIVNAPPPAPAPARKFGTICVVGEFEDGPYNTPTKLTSGSSPFGGFGYQYGTSKYQHPCAYRSGGTEYWNGNAWVQTAKLVFGNLVFVRANTSVGSITLTPLAFLQTTIKPPFNLDNGLTFIYERNDSGSDTTVTFAAASAAITGSSGTFNTFTGGETFEVAKSSESYVTITIQAGDNTASLIAARINVYMGFEFATVVGGQIKLTDPVKGTSSKVQVKANTVTDTLGLTADASTDASASGTGDAADISQMTFEEFKTKVETANVRVSLTANGYVRISSLAAGTGMMQCKSGTANDYLGLEAKADPVTAATTKDITLAAGLRANDGGDEATRVVTTQTTTIASGTTDATSFYVRPAQDDGSFVGFAANSIDTLEDDAARLGDWEWKVTNPASLSNALTAAQLDSAYQTAIEATLGSGDPVKRGIDGIVSARQSNAIRSALKTNAVTATTSGHNTRRAFICPPNGTSETTIRGSSSPGVGAYRSKYGSMAVGSLKCFMQEMVDGGYADDNDNIVRHPDTFLASRWSALNPGLNPGQLPEETRLQWTSDFVTGLGDEASSWTSETYAAFHEAGVCAAFLHDILGLTFEQGITTVDPTVSPEDVSIARVTLEGYVGDSLASQTLAEAKRQGTKERIELQISRAENFFEGLTSGKNAVISAYEMVEVPTSVANLRRFDVKINQIESADVWLFNLSVGPNAISISSGGT